MIARVNTRRPQTGVQALHPTEARGRARSSEAMFRERSQGDARQGLPRRAAPMPLAPTRLGSGVSVRRLSLPSPLRRRVVRERREVLRAAYETSQPDDRMNGLREVCRCGHAKDTHHEKKHACTGLACDCPAYRDENSKEAPPTEPSIRIATDDDPRRRNRPHADPSCGCAACLSYRRRLWGGW